MEYNSTISGYFSLILSVLLILFSYNVSAEESDIRIRGYIKSVATITDLTGLDIEITGSNADTVTNFEGALINTLRLSLIWQPDESVSAELAYELVPSLQNTGGSGSVFSIRAADPLSYRAADLGERVYSSNYGSDFQLFHNMDRAYITLSPAFGDIHIGRQPVAFGSARVINPTDIFTSFTYTELIKEERVGIDAIRLKVPAGAMGELDTGMVFGDDFSSRESAVFFRAKFFSQNTDISPIAVLFKQNLLLGIDIARSIGDAGYWFEGGHTFANITDNHTQDQDYFRASTGFDYSFTDKLYVYIEYHFNEAGASSANDYNKLISGIVNRTAYQEGAVYLYGRHYLAPGFTYQLTPLLTCSTGALYNIEDGSVLIFPGLQYSLSDEALIEMGAFTGFGKGGRVIRDTDTGALSISANSEFGLYPDTYFISAKLYF
jgi:hypothetical protein